MVLLFLIFIMWNKKLQIFITNENISYGVDRFASQHLIPISQPEQTY